MALTARQRRSLEEIRTEIAQLDHRITVAHGLGDSSSVQGTTTTYNELPKWTKRRDDLRRLRDHFEALEAGETPSQSSAGILVSRFQPD